MAAILIPAAAPGLPHLLQLPDPTGAATLLEEVRFGLGQNDLSGALELEAGDWLLRVSELRRLVELLDRRGLQLQGVRSRRPETQVVAAGLGLATAEASTRNEAAEREAAPARTAAGLLIHQGTLRAGDHLQSEDSVLLLGDLNPGARISAGGDVLVWGRLRGVAHAGCHGNSNARIVALQLRPLQLRIAGSVARGPAEAPAPGQAEQAQLVDGDIRIEPASPLWPVP